MLTVNVASNAPTSVTNTASVAGGGEINTGNDSANDPTTVNQKRADRTDELRRNRHRDITGRPHLGRGDARHGLHYQVFRSANNGPYGLVGSSVTGSFTDTGLISNTTYLYQIT